MTDDSPVVAAEPRIAEIPLFEKKQARALSVILNPSEPLIKRQNSKAFTSKFEENALKKSASSLFGSVISKCNCPHVLIADDDPFQHLYYQTLFQKSIDFEGVHIDKENLKVQLCFSGEDLLKKYNQTCSCNQIMLGIIDYHMGDTKLNGVHVCMKLREVGYNGPLLLRTSETKEYLNGKHRNFEELLEEKIINGLVEKTNLKESNSVIQNHLKEQCRLRSTKAV